MKRKMKWFFTIVSGSLLVLSSCTSSQKAPLAGGDKDKHGCIPSAGYTWSEVRKDCIRIFETGIRLNNTLNKDATVSAFVVFSPDSSVVELFLPDMKKRPLLQKEGDNWKNKIFEVKRIDGKLALYKKEKLIYQE